MLHCRLLEYCTATEKEAVNIIRQHEEESGMQFVVTCRDKFFGTNGIHVINTLEMFIDIRNVT